MTSLPDSIVRASDAGKHPAEIAAALSVTPGYVYGILRRERPDRTRKPRTLTSDVPRKVLGLHGQGIRPARIAFLLRISRAYVYRVIAEAKE